MDDIKSVKFTSLFPEECWRQYQSARHTRDFDHEHYPEIDHFWHHEAVGITGVKEYTLVVIYGRDIAPNM
jgi:hypothetical protein